MNCHDQHKRAFSQAFPPMNQPRFIDGYTQSAKRILSYQRNTSDHYLPEFEQENDVPLDLDCAPAFDEAPGTQVRHPVSVDSRHVDYNHASLHYELYSNGSGSRIQANPEGLSPALLQNEQPRDRSQSEAPLLTPLIVSGQSMLGPSPYIRPDISSPLNNCVHPCLQNASAYNDYSDGDSPMSDATTAVGPLTPSALNFGSLSLNNQGHSISSFSVRVSIHGNRATVTVMPTSCFAESFPAINPNEVIVAFDKGREIRKVDKYPLCNASRFFAQLLDGPFLDQGLTRRIRLRDDFPYAIVIMLHFIETGHYVFDQRAFQRFPLLTTLDFHVHTYLVSSKYGITALRDCAIKAYLDITEHELKLGFPMLKDNRGSQVQVSMPGFPTQAVADEQTSEGHVITPIDRFLNSLVLLWKHTPSRYDALRKAVLELVKRDLNKLMRVPFFVTLLHEMVGFGDDVVASLREDGFEVQAEQVLAGGRQDCTVRFGV